MDSATTSTRSGNQEPPEGEPGDPVIAVPGIDCANEEHDSTRELRIVV